MKTGFIYIWRDKLRNMYYVGSHDGELTDDYISSSRWLNGEINYRPHDFKRRIIKMIDIKLMKIEEYRIIKMIKESEFGSRYYNLKSGKPKGSSPWNKGKTGIYSVETIDKMSKARIGKPTTNGMKMPSAALNGKKSAKKQSETVTGRKRKYNNDGSWTWEYPKQ